MFIGTIINAVTIIAGSVLGVWMGSVLSPKLRETIIAGLGLFTFGYGMVSFIGTGNPLVPLGGLLIGALLGEWWKIEEGLENLGVFLKKAVIKKVEVTGAETRFVEGFVTASLVFVVGPIAILGSIQNGLTGNFEMLAIKAILDGFASIAFASTLGIGVAFSALSITLYQGGITLLSSVISRFLSEAMMIEMTAAGGLILMAIALSSLLKVKQIRTGSFLPALLITPLIMFILDRFFGGF
jgi:uncharacterized protein